MRTFLSPRLMVLAVGLLGVLLSSMLPSTTAVAQTSSVDLPDVVLDVSVISLTERDDSTHITVTAALREAAAADTTVTLALDEDAPLLTPGIESNADSGTDYATGLDSSNNTITIAAGSASGQTAFSIDPKYDDAVEGDEAIVLTGATAEGVVAPTDIIIEDGPYLSFPKYIYGHLSYPGQSVSITIEEAINSTYATSTVSYILTGTEPSDDPLGLTFDPATRKLTGTAPAASDVPDSGITTRYTITARDSAGRLATTLVSVAVVRDACGSTKTTWFHATEQPPAELVYDCNVLLAARDTLTGTTGTLNWATDTPIDSWDGLTEFHVDVKWIRRIELQLRRLDGTIPPVLGHLASPGSLDIVLGGDYRRTHTALENKLTGPIPPELGLPSNMIVLALSYNNLSGPIPRELANNGKLRFLYLHDTDKPASGATGPAPPGVSGPIPPEFSDAPMRGLTISGNPGVNGHIPWQLGKLVSKGSYPGLQVLNLSHNSLDGNIPWQLGRFGKIQQLALTGNRLTGSIPWHLGNLGNEEADVQRRIAYLHLNDNQLTGPIPPQLGNIANLAVLSLSKNRLTGPIPAELGGLSKLWYLYLRDNQLSGPIPSELGNLGALRELFLSNNRLSGEIPAEFGSLVNLTALSLSSNNLSGYIPEALNGLTKLTRWRLAGNSLVGCLPHNLAQVDDSDAASLNLPACQASSVCVDGGAVSSGDIGLAAECDILLAVKARLRGSARLNWWSGRSIERWDGIEVQDGRVVGVSLPNRDLDGFIPAGLGSLSALRTLDLSSNSLTGAIPPELASLVNLENLSLSSNNLSGHIPESLNGLARLTRWRLAGNSLVGCLPHNLAQVNDSDAARLDLPVCQTNDGMPTASVVCVTGAAVPDAALNPGLVVDCDILLTVKARLRGSDRLNWWSGRSIEEWDGIEVQDGRVVGVSLSNRDLDGIIPAGLSRLSTLRTLDLSFNDLTGTIPSELGSLVNLETLSLSSNNLSGHIPEALNGLTKLTRWRLAGNSLVGCLPHNLAQVDDSDAASLGLPACRTE